MGFYENRILPHLIHLACGAESVMKQRRMVVPQARGRVVEVGMGSGINLTLYDPERVELVWGLEPSQAMRKKAQKNLDSSPVNVEWLGLPGEEIPLEDDSADTVVLTYTLCTIPDWLQALHQMRRVLKPGGKLLFCEHGEAPDREVRKWQERINPYWKRFAGGCNLNRRIPDCIEEGGFSVQELETEYNDRPKFASFIYRGFAE